MNHKDFSFSERAEKYDDGFEGKFSQKFYQALLSQIKIKSSKTVLDVGCGTGYLLRKIDDSHRINGYGISPFF